MRLRCTVVSCLALFPLIGLVSARVFAHSDEYFDRNPSPHGGQVRMAGPYHFELVVGEGELVIYVTDHADQPIDTAGANGSARVASKAGKQEIALTPAGGNVLKASAVVERAADLKVDLTVTMPGKSAQKARFTPFRK